MKLLNLSSSPHLHHPDSTTGVMLDVIIALIPATICGIYLFGFHAALIVAVCVASAVIAEYLWCLILKKPQPVKDLSAVLTGLILSLNLPGTLPLWMAALGSVIAIIIVKQMFGGLGQNFANPALTARIVLMVSFPSYMTRFCYPFTDTVSAATPLAGGSVPNQTLFLGNYAGCIGETSALCLLMGGLYLVCRRVISPATPLAYFATAAAMALLLGQDPIAALFSGGLMLGAIYMATDYATTPNTLLGKIIFGVGCGVITMVIRRFGNMPEGVSFSILLMNILTPHLNRLGAKKPFGWEEKAHA